MIRHYFCPQKYGKVDQNKEIKTMQAMTSKKNIHDLIIKAESLVFQAFETPYTIQKKKKLKN